MNIPKNHVFSSNFKEQKYKKIPEHNSTHPKKYQFYKKQLIFHIINVFLV